MSSPPQDPAGGAPAPRFDDPTRDIRLPSQPDRPPANVRPEWQAHVAPRPAHDRPVAASGEPEPPAPQAQAREAVSANRPSESLPPRPNALPNEPTDELSAPPRQQTLAFDSPAGGAGAPHSLGSAGPGQGGPQLGAAPVGPRPYGPPGPGPAPYGPAGQWAPADGSPPVVAAERKRRWPWVVLILLPLLVIVGAGLLLLFLLGGM